jgi:LmbE family N-acetylglucosaminyl deacetylase
MTVLVVAAHPDDEVLGCGATLSRLAREGHEVHIAILATGITSRYARIEEADPAELTRLQGHAQRAADLMGARKLYLGRFPDNRMDSVPLLEVVQYVEGLVNEIKPEVIYTHHTGDMNIDHLVVSRAVMTATRPMAGQPVKEIYAFEVGSSTEWAFQRFEPAFHANVFVEIGSQDLEIKIRAMACYESEARAFPHPRSPEAIRIVAQRWGTVVGCMAAEPFDLIRSVRLRNR